MQRFRRLWAIAAVLGGLLGGLVATSTSASGAVTVLPSVGVQFHGMWADYTDAQRAQVLDQMAAAHVQWVRVDMCWDGFEPSAGGSIDPWYLGMADSVVNLARARGLKVLATVLCTPGWANGGQGQSVPPTNPAAYANVMRYLAGHFAARVGAWEIWNEPNLDSFWSTRDPAQYAALVRAAYPAVKAGDPNALVVAGAVSQNDTAWLSRMFDAGVAGSYDVLSTHPYQGPSNGIPELPDDGNAWILDHIGAVHNLMVARGDGAKPIWATELGWSTHANTGTEPPWQLGVTEAQQADYLVRTINLFASKHPYVTNMFWYNDRDKATGIPQEDGYGLLHRDLTPKPAMAALQSALAPAAAATTTTTAPPATTSTTAAPTTTTAAPSPSSTTTTAAPAHAEPSKRRKTGVTGAPRMPLIVLRF